LRSAIRSQVNAPGATEAGEQYDQLIDDPVVTAPLYGGLPAGRTTVGALGDPPLWLGQLNLAPQQRAVAGLAAEAVRRDQEAIMAEAWTQAAGIRSVNAYLTSANAAAAFGARWERRLVSTEAGVADDTLLRITASAHGRMSADKNRTVAGVLTGHADFARAAFAPTLTRVSHLRGRPQRLGLVSRGAPTLASQIASSLFANTGRYANVVLRAAPAGSSLADDAWLERMTAAISGRPVVTRPVASPYPTGLHGFEPDVVSAVFEGLSGAASAVLEHRGAGEPAWVGLTDAVQVTSGLATALAAGATRAGNLEGRLTKEARRSLSALAVYASEIAKRSAELLELMPDSGSVSARQRTKVTQFVEQALQLNQLATQVWEMFKAGSGTVSAPEPRDPGELLALGTKLRRAIDVVATVVSAVKQRVTPEPMVGVDRLPPPALAAQPTFAQPGFQRMLDVGIEYLCPGIDQIGTDAVSLLETNQATIESFLVGLNHELAREFLWREYPVVLTDTWMTRFWSLAGGADEIEPIAEWGTRRELGAGGPDAQAVVFIRGELLVRYPTALVYLLPGIVTGTGRSAVISPDYLQPIPPTFGAALGRGARAYGFPVATADLGANLDNKDGGYFVVIEEQPGDPRFGLDDGDPSQFTQDPASLGSWDSLGWGHLVSNQAELDTLTHARLDGVRVAGLEIEEDTWGDDAAAMARIALRRPYRIIAHAETLLP
ncbi:MAG: hypothetical protein OEW24_09615, partial [Chloroflexota bacterium]|nr:hypothetical protein [Chloroflexota bacterium]